MKTLLIFILGLIAGLVLTYGLCATGNLPFECASDGSIVIVDSTGNVTPIDTTTDEDIIDYQMAEQYINDNDARDCSIKIDGCKGGRIEIATLTNLISQVEVGKTYINYRFGLSQSDYDNAGAVAATTTPHVVLMLSAGNFSAASTKEIIANGNRRESFCPFSCD